MENKRIYYDFCPVCSGLMKNGVCLSCGCEKSEEIEEGAQEHKDSVAVKEPQRRTNRRILAGLGVGAVVALLVLCVAVYMIVQDVQKRSPALIQISGTTDTAAEAKDSYVPDPADLYYAELADARREDLFYHVDWQMYNAANETGTTIWTVQYPVLSGEVANLEKINQTIEEAARVLDPLGDVDAGEEQDNYCHIQGESFVTYMDEEKISIVLRISVYRNGVRIPQLCALNFDIQEGEQIRKSDMVEISPGLVEKFRKQNAEQNSLDLEEAGWSDETLFAFLQGDDGFAFYTPVGLEIGFNYRQTGNYGWVTVTLKNP